MKNDVIISLLSDVSSFSFGIFGIGLGIFTVLYAFILSRKDSLRDLNDIIKAGNDDPFLRQRVSFFAAHTNRWKNLNNNIAAIIIISFLFYITTILLKYQAFTDTLILFVKALCLLTGLLVVYVIVMLYFVFKNYIKETSIN